jgi:hypothetical protein
MDVNGKVALIEYLCFRYGKSVEQLVNAPQGDTTKVDEAQAKLVAVQVCLQILFLLTTLLLGRFS